ncbi:MULTISPECIES: hypothetical protein [Paenalcaligenes]|uniref:DUF3318 domain-containing protein n=1 Tax=Paenalcaligenes hermetiae TaxID=1157987 RepID=A0ABP9M0W2_9BURK|nr:hypothetical protein [Paenalcaligenes sp.]
MAKKTEINRLVRIELLRARAELERREACYLAREISSSLQPEHLLGMVKGQFTQGLSASFGAGSKAGGWLDFVLSLGKRYPLVVSGLSALAGTVVGKKKWRLGALAMTGWRLFSAYQKLQKKKKEKYIQPSQPKSGRVIGPF